MLRRLARKLMFSITLIVIIVAAVSRLVNVKSEERQLLNTMSLGADQLSKSIAPPGALRRKKLRDVAIGQCAADRSQARCLRHGLRSAIV
jgi:hypothetical protein